METSRLRPHITWVGRALAPARRILALGVHRPGRVAAIVQQNRLLVVPEQKVVIWVNDTTACKSFPVKGSAMNAHGIKSRP